MITRGSNLSILKRISKQVGIPLIPIIASLAAQVSFANVSTAEKKSLFVIHDDNKTKLSAIDFQISEINGGIQFSIEGIGSTFEAQFTESGLEKFLTQKDYIPSASSNEDYEVAIRGYIPKDLRPSFNLAQSGNTSGSGKRSPEIPTWELGTLKNINDSSIYQQFNQKLPSIEVQDHTKSLKKK